MLPANNEDDMSYEECTDDLNRVCKDLANCAGDTSIALSQISDNNVFFEVKADYAKDMVCGFIKLNGSTVGAVANRDLRCRRKPDRNHGCSIIRKRSKKSSRLRKIL